MIDEGDRRGQRLLQQTMVDLNHINDGPDPRFGAIVELGYGGLTDPLTC